MASSAETRNHLGPSEPAIAAAYGFVPTLFQAQSELPAAIEAESDLINAILLQGPALPRAEKDAILSAVASVRANSYVFGLHQHQKESAPPTSLLIEFAVKLALYGPCLSNGDFDLLRQAGFTDAAILETIATVALGNMLCTLADALNPAPNGTTTLVQMPVVTTPTTVPEWNVGFGPYLHFEGSPRVELPQFGTLRDQFGFTPKLFQLQSPWPELLGADCRALELVVWNEDHEDHLSRIQKELVLLVTATANLNTYGVALQSQVLSLLGLSIEDCEGIICDLGHLSLKKEDQALLAQISLLAGRPRGRVEFDMKFLEYASVRLGRSA